MSSESEQKDGKQFTYCPECGKILEIKESDDINSINLCSKCFSNHRPKF